MSNSRKIASLPNTLTLLDDAGGEFLAQQAAATTTSYTVTWPAAVGGSGAVLGTTDASGAMGWLTTLSGITLENTVIGGSTPAAITGTTITANNGFTGTLYGNVTGNVTGNLTGNVTGDVTGLLSGTLNSSVNGSTMPVGDNSTRIATTAFVQAELSNGIADLIDQAPSTLDTLNELAAALGDDANFATTVTNSLAGKLSTTGGDLTGDLNFSDNKALFNSGTNQLQVYHDGTNSIIKHTGSSAGRLTLVAEQFHVTNLEQTQSVIHGYDDAHVSLYYNGSVKLQTANTGVDVTGALTASGSITGTELHGTLQTAAQPNITSLGTLTSDIELNDHVKVSFGDSQDFQIYHDHSDTAGFTRNKFDITKGGLQFNISGGEKGFNVYFEGTQMLSIASGGTSIYNLIDAGKLKSNYHGIDLTTANKILPYDHAAPGDSDNAIALGSSSYRFSELHAAGIYGTLQTAAQTNITSVGTLSSLAVSGDVTVDTNTLKVDTTNNRVGILDASPDVTLDIGAATDAVSMPVGTTAQRPSSPAPGYLRYNSSLNKFEGYTDAWGEIGGGGSNTGSDLNIDTMTGDSSTVAMTLSIAPVNENNTQVYFDGVYQSKANYSISGTTLTFSTAPPTGVAVEVMTMTQTEINVPVNDTIDTVHIKDNAVTAAKLTANSVTTAKILDDNVTAAKLEHSINLVGNPTTTTQTAGDNSTKIATTAYADTASANAAAAVVDSAPSTLDTLNELAAALGDDPNFATTVTNSIAGKLPLAGGTMTGAIANFTSTGIDDNASSTTVTIDSSGNVGIGTSNPNSVSKLQVEDTTASNTSTYISVVSGNGGNAGIAFGDSDADLRGGILYNNDDDALRFFKSGFTEAMRINSGGKVTIGGESTTRSLNIDGTADAYMSFNPSSHRKFTVGSDDSGFVVFDDTAGAYRAVINASGSVGIGASSIATNTKLHVKAGTNLNFEVENSSSTLRLSALNDARSANVPMQFASSSFQFITGSVAVGHTSSGGAKFAISDSGNATIQFFPEISTDTNLTQHYDLAAAAYMTSDNRAAGHLFKIGTSEAMRIDSSGNITQTFSDGSNVTAGNMPSITGYTLTNITNSNGSGAKLEFSLNNGSAKAAIAAEQSATTSSSLNFYTENSGTFAERMRIDSSGNVLVSTTDTTLFNNTSGGGIALMASNRLDVARVGDVVQTLNRMSSEGSILQFYLRGVRCGDIVGVGTAGMAFAAPSDGGGGILVNDNANIIYPARNSSGTVAASDNTIDLGTGGVRFQDVFATNGTIQTSDRNEKQDIEELSDAEQRVAVAAKGLLRKFRWKSAVEEKGDDARIHFGIIAQDLQDAFTAEGLDAGRYAMFISSTWTDEETGEERTRLGVRYSELLAFIISAI